jgi:hypothetical protein
MPKEGREAHPALSSHQGAGWGVMVIIPVSVCHQVSTMGHRPPPTVCEWQQVIKILMMICPNVIRRSKVQILDKGIMQCSSANIIFLLTSWYQ